jgi:hypothetical protein
LKKNYSLNEDQKRKSLSIAKLYREQLISFSELPSLSKLFFKDLTKKVNGIPLDLKDQLNKLSDDILNLKK